MKWTLADAVVDFYYDLYDRLFSVPFSAFLTQRLRRDEVRRQVQDIAAAASQSLSRFLEGRKLSQAAAKRLLSEFSAIPKHLIRDEIASANVAPQSLAADLFLKLRKGKRTPLRGTEKAVYTVALQSVVETLCFVGPVLKEWERLQFSRTFEPPRRVVGQLQEITDRMESRSGKAGNSADEGYALEHRDYLLQRFYRAEVGTVRMTTNMAVDLRQLFVMPLARLSREEKAAGAAAQQELEFELEELMTLSVARGALRERKDVSSKKNDLPLLDLVRQHERLVVVGRPGSGKSTFVEWLQMLLASGGDPGDEFPLQGEQAMPLLLRVRELDMKQLPSGADLIEKATASKQRAALMPKGWIERHLHSGVVFVILDGLDEVEPALRDKVLLPWLEKFLRDYPQCRYLVTSRPVGYDRDQFHGLHFAQCELLDFDESRVAEYARHWCAAIRLAQNEPDKEAREEGNKEGDRILASFRDHAYIRDLACNPLMLSAICLVNYFEKGRLPDDRNLLYQLCVEGLLHHWDHRRGIHSDFGLEEKLRVCREIAFEMQLADKAEASQDTVLEIMTRVLGDKKRAEHLMEHIRYRTGLLVERRAGVFAFAHLTFQEYLAARAMHEGDHSDFTPARLAAEHADDRWREVIVLFAAQAGVTAERALLESLLTCADSSRLPEILEDVIFSCKPEVREDKSLRRRVIERCCIHPARSKKVLARFPVDEVAPTANNLVATNLNHISSAYWWLVHNSGSVDHKVILQKLANQNQLTAIQCGELIFLTFRFGELASLNKLLGEQTLLSESGPIFRESGYPSLAWVAGQGLGGRTSEEAITQQQFLRISLEILRIMAMAKRQPSTYGHDYVNWIKRLSDIDLDESAFAAVKSTCQRLLELMPQPSRLEGFVQTLQEWMTKLNLPPGSPTTISPPAPEP